MNNKVEVARAVTVIGLVIVAVAFLAIGMVQESAAVTLLGIFFKMKF